MQDEVVAGGQETLLRTPLPRRPRSSVRGRLWAAVARDAGEAGISPALGRGVLWFPAAGGALVAVTYVHKALFRWLLEEDHPIEWLQFTVLAFTVLTAALGAVRMARRRHWAAAGLYLVFTLGALALAGEEISWGQRVFALAEPLGLGSINDQHELSLHNIKDGSLNLDELSDYISALMSGCLLALSLTVRAPRAVTGRPIRAFDRPAWKVISPPLVFVPGLVLSTLYPLGQLVPAIGRTGAYWGFEEWTELCRYLNLAGLAVVATSSYRRMPAHGPDRGRRLAAGGPGRPPLFDADLIGYAVFSAVLTVVFAALTLHTGLRAVNG